MNPFPSSKNKDKLVKLSFSKFAEIFIVNRKTTSSNQINVDFHNDNRFEYKPKLKIIYEKIENIIIK